MCRHTVLSCLTPRHPGTFPPRVRRLFLIILWLLFAHASQAGEAASPRVQRVSFQGRDYVKVSSWAPVAGLTARWLVPDKELQLFNSKVTLHLSHDSRRFRCNGVWVWLSAPIIMKDREALIPYLDISTTVNPILSPTPSRRPPRIICLDAGHGGDDTGNRHGGRLEKEYTLLLTREVGKLLTRAGYSVIYTRTTDRRVDRADRPLKARQTQADLFLSLHYNAAEVPSAQGVEVYSLTPAGASSTNAGGEGADSPSYAGNRWDERNMQLAFFLQKSLSQKLGREDRGARRARFEVLREATMPAVLIEGGFMSNPTELRWITSSAERTRLAQAIVDGVASYQKWIGAK